MEGDNPYRPPSATLGAGFPTAAVRPAVLTWFTVYCIFMALLYLFVAMVGVIFLASDPDDMGRGEAMMMGMVFIGLGLVFAVPYGVAPFLKPQSWTWILGVVLIGLGLTSCLTMPATIPLIIYWIKPETQAYFGRGSTQPAARSKILPNQPTR